MASPVSQRRFPGLAERRRVEAALIALLGALTVLAWILTVHRMRGMDMGPNTDPGTLGFFVGIWLVMMAAMMFPSAAPMVTVHARVAKMPSATALFVAGYLAVWTAVGVLGYSIAVAARHADIGVLSWDRGGRYVVSGVLLAAAVYQLTPLKDRCLSKCRSPLGFVVTNWRSGRLGALRMGAEHGAWCVGCCWALMASLFALGVMSITWMLVVAALIAGEKLLPWKAAANRGIALLLVAVAVFVAVAPGSLPGLTIPGAM
jgi:predicted metal-binding membrane protein